MSHIIIGFSKPRKFKLLSWLIRKAEKTDFSHVYVKIYAPSISRFMVYEASGMLVHCSTQETFYLKNYDLEEYVLDCSDEDKQEILSTIVDCLALPYGFWQLVGLGLVRFCRLFGTKIKNPFADGRQTYICSEFCGVILQKLDYNIEDLDELTPKDIHEIIHGSLIKAKKQ